jgi:hypothetical protein
MPVVARTPAGFLDLVSYIHAQTCPGALLGQISAQGILSKICDTMMILPLFGIDPHQGILP